MTEPSQPVSALQAQTNEVQQMIHDDLNKGCGKIFDGLVMTPITHRLPERIFRDYFLAGFIGKHTNPRWTMEWVSVAGTPNSEVIIFDEATDEELFRVPPLVASSNVLLGNNVRGRFKDVFAHTMQLGANVPASGNNFMYNALNQRSAAIVESTNLDPVFQQWEVIFARYGLREEVQQQTPQQTDGGDYFDFD